jgi:hypothetical protein
MTKLAVLFTAVACVAGFTSQAQSEAVFTIVKEQSSVQGGGHVAGYPIVEQGPGSLVTTCVGEIRVVLSANTIQFLPATSIDAEINGEWQPGAGGQPGFSPADFAGQANVILAQVKGAFRNILLSARSPSIALANGSFNGSSIVLEFPTNSPAVFDYNGGWFGMDSMSLAGWNTPLSNSVGTITEAGGKQTITLPFEGAFPFSAASANDSEIRIKGKIVATRSLVSQPEFTGIVKQGDTVILTGSNVAANAQLQSSPDLMAWDSQPAVRTDNGATTQFTLQSDTPAAFYRLVVP